MKKLFKRRNIIIGIVAFIVLLIVGKSMGWIGKSGLPEVETAKVQRKTIIETINASGKLQPKTEVKISAGVSGEIIELTVKEGAMVTKGQLLVRIKPDNAESMVEKAMAGVNQMEAQVASSKAAKSQAEAQLAKAKLMYNRNKILFDQKAISQTEFENFETEYEVAKSQLESAQQGIKAAEFTLASARAGLKEAQDSKNKTLIYSPMTGTVSKLNMKVGEQVLGTMQMQGSEIMRIADMSVMEVQLDVNENDIVRLHKGDTANVEIDAYRNDKFKGIVTEVASSASSDNLSLDKATNFSVKIKLLASSYAHLVKDTMKETPFRPGMSASVEIKTNTISNVLSVPILAVTVRKDLAKKDDETAEEEEVVFVFEKNQVKQRKVKTGIQDDKNIEILEGLKEGETVVSGPYATVSKDLKDGQKVQEEKKKSEGEGEEGELNAK